MSYLHLHSPLQRHLHGLEQLAALGGPKGEHAILFSAWVAELSHMIKTGVIRRDEWFEVWKPVVLRLLSQTIAPKILLKPRGYAGDFEVIDCIYTSALAECPQQRPWDDYFHSLNAISAVKHRKSYFQRVVSSAVAASVQCGADCPRILNVASGPGRDMLEWLSANPTVQAKIECVEMDADAIKFATELCHQHRDRVQFHHANALRFKPAGEYALIWSAGLFDYLNDGLFVRLLRRLLNHTLPGGEVVIGNFGSYNPSRDCMELLGDWVLEHRSPEHLRELALEAGASEGDISIGREPACVNLFLHVRKPMLNQ